MQIAYSWNRGEGAERRGIGIPPNSGFNGSVTLGGWIDAKGKVSWGTEVTQWGPGAKTQ